MIPGDEDRHRRCSEQALRALDAVLPGVDTTALRPGRAALAPHRGDAAGTRSLEEIRGHDAILLGAAGDASAPSGVLERGLLLRLRFELDHYVNLRPVRLYPGVASPLAKGSPESIDMVVVREGTEGPYTGTGGVLRRGTPHEVATEVSVRRAASRGSGRVGSRGVLSGPWRTAAGSSSRWCTEADVLALAGRPVAALRFDSPCAAECPDVTSASRPRRRTASMYLRSPSAGRLRRDRDRRPARRHLLTDLRRAADRRAASDSRRAATSTPTAPVPVDVRAGARAARRTSPGQSRRPTRPRRSCPRRCCAGTSALPGAAAKIELGGRGRCSSSDQGEQGPRQGLPWR